MMVRLKSSRPYAYQELSPPEILRRMKATVADGTEAGDVVTVGGLLALGSYPQEYFPQLMLAFVHYPTERGSDEENGPDSSTAWRSKGR
ncbi:hypothetical protein ACIA5C_26355 [Actinoplanes sp. NPDC051343]|uniref:hypothetical protein n=1 Tax=Actinoplanes sp. NPDC051343 TaxID=3363906 RepID=UPI0037A7102B